MSDDVAVGPLYAGSDGQYYTDWEVGQKVRAGRWGPCLWHGPTDRQFVTTETNELLILITVKKDELPFSKEICYDCVGTHIVDARSLSHHSK